MSSSTSKSKTLILSQKRVGCFLQERGETLRLVKEWKHLENSYTSDGQREQIWSAVAVLKSMNWSIVVTQWTKIVLLVNLCTYPHLQFQAMVVKEQGHEYRQQRWVEPPSLQIERSQMRWFRYLAKVPLSPIVNSWLVLESLKNYPCLPSNFNFQTD